MVWKRWAALALTCTLLCTLTACGQETQPAESPETDTPAAAEPVPAVDPSLTGLRATLSERVSPWAIAFLGTLPDGASPQDLLAETDYLEDYPFLGDITGHQVVTYQGTEVYCVVPRDEDATLTVQEVIDEKPGKTLYEGDGQPVILVCNVSDVIPNLLVTVTAPDGSQVSYSPTLSLCDGSVALPADSAIYDFSRYSPYSTNTTGVSFLGDWTATVPLEGREVLCALSFQENEAMTYKVGSPDSQWMDIYDGTYYVIGENSQYPAGSVLFELTSTMDGNPFWGVFSLTVSGDSLAVTHVSGDSLLSGSHGQAISFTAQ